MFPRINLKATYYKNILEENKFNIKKIWSILKQAIGKTNNKSNFPNSFNIKNVTVTDKQEASEGFNDFFSKIGLHTSHSVPKTNTCFKSYMPPLLPNSIFIEPVSHSDVLNSVNKLKSKASCGYDNVSTKLLKESIQYIIEPLTHIINRSFDTGIVPNQMKIAKVIPIYKTADKTLLKNYRPISLLPAFSKVIEKLMCIKITSFFNSHNLFYEHQYGFRAKHSTSHPLIHLLNHCAESASNNNHFTLAIFCDLSKAFDVINHDILLHKLNTYGIRGVSNLWFQSYLKGRSQFVDLEGHISAHADISCGVPQGSILGPLLYLIYVNDIYNACEGNILSFADDTTIYLSDSNLDNLFTSANSYINNLFDWFCANRLSLNAQKNKYIVIKPLHVRCNLTNFNIQIKDTPLIRVGNDCMDKLSCCKNVLFRL